MKWILTIVFVGACGAQQVKVEPVKIEPIHITVDVNLHETSSSGTASRSRER